MLPHLNSTGTIILLADGVLKLEVESIINGKELVARVLNQQKLGEAKLVSSSSFNPFPTARVPTDVDLNIHDQCTLQNS
jgi:pyruvate kinase